MIFNFSPENSPNEQLRLKVEINNREHENVFGIKRFQFRMNNDWYSANAGTVSFDADELFATKLRALLQRRKNRDLFDLYAGIEQRLIDYDRLVTCFEHYVGLANFPITRAEAEKRMLKKLQSSLTDDVSPLLPVGVCYDNDVSIRAFNLVWTKLIARIKGDPWQSSEPVIEKLRFRLPNLLL